jgi:tRNA1(Val) A37 N6-methylase TrmN6
MLADNGSLWVILPVKESLEFIELAEDHDFFVQYMLKLIPKTGKEPKRVVLRFKKAKTSEIQIETLTQWAADGEFSEKYKKFTGEFYIDF